MAKINFLQRLIRSLAPSVFRPVPTGVLYVMLQSISREISGICPWDTGESCWKNYTSNWSLNCRNILCSGYRHPIGLIAYTSRSATTSSIDNRFDYSSFRKLSVAPGGDWIPVGTLGAEVLFDFGDVTDAGGFGAGFFGARYWGDNSYTSTGIDVHIGDKWYIACHASSTVIGTDGKNYICRLAHTSSAADRPIFGANWALYWKIGGSDGDPWQSGVSYDVTSVIGPPVPDGANEGIYNALYSGGTYTGDHDTIYTVELIDFWGYVQNYEDALLQINLSTCTDEWLDFWGDYFGLDRLLLIGGYEVDSAYRERILKEITRAKGTKAVLLDEAKTYFGSDLVTITEYYTGGAQSVVEIGGIYYKCISSHTSATATNRPGTGTNWTSFWEVGGLGGNTWVNGIDYISGATSIRWDGPVDNTRVPPAVVADPAYGLWPWQFYINLPTQRAPSSKFIKIGSSFEEAGEIWTYEGGTGYLYPFGTFVKLTDFTHTPGTLPLQGGRDVSHTNKDNLLHFNGPNHSTTITDGYGYGNVWTCYGNAKLDTTDKKWGSASLELDGTNSYIRNVQSIVDVDGVYYKCILSHTSATATNKPKYGSSWTKYWELSTLGGLPWTNATPYTSSITSLGNKFTVEGWFHTDDASIPRQSIFAALGPGGVGLYLAYYMNDKKLCLYASSNGTTWDISSGTEGVKDNFASNTWYKWVIDYDGSSYWVCVGEVGTLVSDILVVSDLHICDITYTEIGSIYGVAFFLDGGIDELRITTDRNRYPSSCDAEIAQFSPGYGCFTFPVNVGDALNFGAEYKFSGVRFKFLTPATGGAYVWEYWTGGATPWTAFIPYAPPLTSGMMTDDTELGGISLAQDGGVYWTVPETGWATADNIPNNIPSTGTNLYWVRCRVVTIPAPPLAPIADQISIMHSGSTNRGHYIGTNDIAISGELGGNSVLFNGLYGTANAAVTTTNTKLTDTRLANAVNAYIGSVIICNGKTMTVTANDATSFTCASWSGGGNPGNGFAWVGAVYLHQPATAPLVSVYIPDLAHGATYRDKNNIYIYREGSFAKPVWETGLQDIIDRLKTAGTAAIINPMD